MHNHRFVRLERSRGLFKLEVEVGPWTRVAEFGMGLPTSRQVQSDEVTTHMQDRRVNFPGVGTFKGSAPCARSLGDKEKGPEVGGYQLAASTAAIPWTV